VRAELPCRAWGTFRGRCWSKSEAITGGPTRIILWPIAFRHEAIVHELLHLKVPNHGRLFKALLKARRNGENLSVKLR
jgi:hypothetical protein